MRKTIAMMVAAGAFGLCGALEAQAMPASSLPASAVPGSLPQAETSHIVKIRQGCGVGFHRGPWGGCRANTAPVGPWGPNACWYRPSPFGPTRVCR